MITKETIQELEALLLEILDSGNEDFTITWEEISHLATEEQESYLLRKLKRVINREGLKNPNLFSVEDVTFEGGKLISLEICYNDEPITNCINN